MELIINEENKNQSVSEEMVQKNASTSLASSVESDTKDVFMNLKKRIKNCVVIQKKAILRIQKIFLFSVFVFMVFSLISSLFLYFINNFVFSKDYLFIIKYVQQGFSSAFAMQCHGNFANLFLKNPDLVLNNSYIFGNFTEESIVVRNLSITDMLESSIKIAHYIEESTASIIESEEALFDFHFYPNTTMKLSFLAAMKDSVLRFIKNGREFEDLQKDLYFLNLNFGNLLENTLMYQNGIESDLSSHYDFYTSFQFYFLLFEFCNKSYFDILFYGVHFVLCIAIIEKF